jgi:hypothetical protein
VVEVGATVMFQLVCCSLELSDIDPEIEIEIELGRGHGRGSAKERRRKAFVYLSCFFPE